MAGTAHALRNALAIDPPPLRVTTDNGVTVFLGVLETHRRRHDQMKAYIFTSENGQIADWWPTFEKARVPGNSVREILDEYTNFWRHVSLRKLVDPAKDTTPTYAWNHWERWTEQDGARDSCS
jgi:hypothetical protein